MLRVSRVLLVVVKVSFCCRVFMKVFFLRMMWLLGVMMRLVFGLRACSLKVV